MLGNKIVKRFLNDTYELHVMNRHHDESVNVFNHICDLKISRNVTKEVKKINPDIIINAAACVNLNICEEDKEYADQINGLVNKAIIEGSRETCLFIYISTDSVFDGREGGYIESDTPSPLNNYAKSKLLGEDIVKEFAQNYLIIRTNIYGFHINGGQSLVEWLVGSLKEEKNISGYDNVIFNPLYVGQLADAIVGLIMANSRGVIHLGSSEYISKYEFCKRVAHTFGFNEQLINKGYLDNKGILQRPFNTTLNTELGDKILDNALLLSNGLDELYKEYRGELNEI